MREWNPAQMKLLFEKKAKEKGYTLDAFYKEFLEELDAPVSVRTLQRYFEEGSEGPGNGKVKDALYKKITRDFGYDMFAEEPTEDGAAELYMEDREKKLPEFCQRKLEEAFEQLLNYFKEAYQGQYTLLFESDYSGLLYLYAVYKPCAPNYLCCEIREFFKNKFAEIKDEAVKNGLIIFEGVGFMYREELEDGEIADVNDCELAEDYIENNQEEHRERVKKFLHDTAVFWRENVERLYQNGTGRASEVCKTLED